MNSLKNGKVPGAPLLKFEGGPGVSLLNFEGPSWGPTFKL